MKLTNNHSTLTITVGKLAPGDTFRHRGEIYIRTDETEPGVSSLWQVLHVPHGVLCTLDQNTVVDRVDAELVIS